MGVGWRSLCTAMLRVKKNIGIHLTTDYIPYHQLCKNFNFNFSVGIGMKELTFTKIIGLSCQNICLSWVILINQLNFWLFLFQKNVHSNFSSIFWCLLLFCNNYFNVIYSFSFLNLGSVERNFEWNILFYQQI